MFNQSQNIKYTVRVSKKAKRMRIAVYCDSSIVVTLPFGSSISSADRFINAKFSWINKVLRKFKVFRPRKSFRQNRAEYLRLREHALNFVEAKVMKWNEIYGFSYNRINIKNQKTRWGSCSKRGNLNFNYRILQLPESVADYLIVHELCHLKEFNHSKNFWHEVSKTMPNYKLLRNQLKNV